MMVISNLKEGQLTVKLIGRMETVAAPRLEEKLKISLRNVKTLIMDMEELEYISSVGISVLFSVQKIMNKQGKMIVRNVNEDVMKAFEEIGAVDVLTIEKGGYVEINT